MTMTTPNTAQGFATDEIVARANECLTMMACAAHTTHDEFPEAIAGWREEIQKAIDLVPSHVTKSPRREAWITALHVSGALAMVALVVFVAAKMAMAAVV